MNGSLLRLTLIMTICMASVACGASTPEVTEPVGAVFSDSDHHLFEDGVDFILDPESLSGTWRKTWNEETDQRVRRSDFIAVGRMQTVSRDTEPNGKIRYRMIMAKDRNLLGRFPKEASFSSREGEAGFGTIDGNDQRLLDTRFVVFAKWEATKTGASIRWHLAPASKEVLSRVRWLIDKRRGSGSGNSTTFVHQD